jgi:hypothetical protein
MATPGRREGGHLQGLNPKGPYNHRPPDVEICHQFLYLYHKDKIWHLMILVDLTTAVLLR